MGSHLGVGLWLCQRNQGLQLCQRRRGKKGPWTILLTGMASMHTRRSWSMLTLQAGRSCSSVVSLTSITSLPDLPAQKTTDTHLCHPVVHVLEKISSMDTSLQNLGLPRAKATMPVRSTSILRESLASILAREMVVSPMLSICPLMWRLFWVTTPQCQIMETLNSRALLRRRYMLDMARGTL